MRKQGGGKHSNYEYIFALYNSASVRNYDVEISVMTQLLPRSHSVNIIAIWGPGR